MKKLEILQSPRKIISILLALMMIISASPWMSASASAPSVNLSQGILATSGSGGSGFGAGTTANLVRVTDGVISTADTAYYNYTGPGYVQIDLGDVVELDYLRLWRYYGDTRRYTNSVVVVSETTAGFSSGVGRTILFNADTGNIYGMGAGTDTDYNESSAGRQFPCNGVTARYVRAYSNGNSANSYGTHVVEFQAWGWPIPEEPGDPAALLTRYNALINTANTNYTTVTWNAFQSALTSAATVLANASATQVTLNNALSTLNTAYGALEVRGDPAALQARYNVLKDVTNTGYTTVTWNAFQNALTAAATALANADASQTTLNNALSALNIAYEALIIGVDPPSAPRNITYTANADGTGTLTWSPNTDYITGYKIACADGAYTSVFNDVAAVPKDQNSYIIPADSAHKWSYYQVYAVNEAGETASSSTVGRERTVFGSNMMIFNAEVDDAARITTAINGTTGYGEFATNRTALLFKPGTYSRDIIIGFYVHVAGLGLLPSDTVVNKVYRTSGGTTTFWRSIENLTYSASGEITYPVSQAAPIRRVYLPNSTRWRFDIAQSVNNENSAWVSGGYLADSYIPSGSIGSWTQQQWYFRNNDATEYFFEPRCHNHFFQGCTGSYDNVNSHEKTIVESTPVIAEKPYLYFKDNEYYVFVPALEYNKIGRSWTGTDPGPGKSFKLEDNFLIAQPNVTTVTEVNDAIAAGRNVFFTPGIYYYDQPIEINRPDAIVMGYGFVTIAPTAGNNAVNIGDVAGVRLASMFLDAGSGFNPDTHYNSSFTMLQVGENGTDFDATNDNPVIIYDVFVRVGGPGTASGVPGRTAPFKSDNGFVINTSNTVIDHTWIWKADHGTTVGWYNNETDYGLVVNGDHVTTYGLMVEHFNKYDVLWNGEYGRLYFLQNEKVYTPVSQANYQGPEDDRRFIYDLGQQVYNPSGDGRYGLPGQYGTTNGWASVRVADHVFNWDGWGLGCYDVYQIRNTSISAANAVVTPLYGNINLVHFLQLYLSQQAGGGTGSGFEYMVNGVGKATQYGMGLTSGASYLLPSNPFDNGNANEWHSMKADAGKIIYFEPVEVTTPLNTAPVLPATAKVRYGDGSWGTVNVSWPTINPADYNAVGKATRHIGTLLDGKEIQTGPLGPATKVLLNLKVEGDAINITAVPTLVQGYNYSMKVDISIDGLDTAKNPNIEYYLYNADTRAQIASSTNIASFPITYTNTNTGQGTNLNQNANSIPRMYILVRWSGDTEYRNTYTINTVPGDLWTVNAEQTGSDLTLTFKQPVGSIGGVSIAGAAFAASISPSDPHKVIVPGAAPNAGYAIIIDQVKFRDIFQSYGFKFTKVF